MRNYKISLDHLRHLEHHFKIPEVSIFCKYPGLWLGFYCTHDSASVDIGAYMSWSLAAESSLGLPEATHWLLLSLQVKMSQVIALKWSHVESSWGAKYSPAFLGVGVAHQLDSDRITIPFSLVIMHSNIMYKSPNMGATADSWILEIQ